MAYYDSNENMLVVQIGDNFDDVADQLVDLNQQGYRNVTCIFNNHELNSNEADDIDSVYLQMFGETKYEHDEAIHRAREEWKERMHREEEEAFANMDDWKQRGYEFIEESKHNEWDECVEGRTKDLYHGADLINALEIMECMAFADENMTPDEVIDEAVQIFNEADHSGASAAMVRSIVKYFGPAGLAEKFIERTAW